MPRDRTLESHHLRGRCRDQRAHSQELVTRSGDLRARLARPHAAAGRPAPAEGAPAPTRVQRLRRAERELELAIAECHAALDEVRREIGWSGAPASAAVH